MAGAGRRPLGAAGAACGLPGQAPPPAQLAPADLTYTTWWVPPGAPGSPPRRRCRRTSRSARTSGCASRRSPTRPRGRWRRCRRWPPAARRRTSRSCARRATPPASPRRGCSSRSTTGCSATGAPPGPTSSPCSWSAGCGRASSGASRRRRGSWSPCTTPRCFARAGQRRRTTPGPGTPGSTRRRRLAALPAQDGARTFGTDDLAMWEVLVWAWGGEILNKPETECVLNRPPAPEALQWRADLLNRHGVVPARRGPDRRPERGARPLRAGAAGHVHGRQLGAGRRANGGPDALERGARPGRQGGALDAGRRRHVRRAQGREAGGRRLGPAGRPGHGRRRQGDGDRVEHAARRSSR